MLQPDLTGANEWVLTGDFEEKPQTDGNALNWHLWKFVCNGQLDRCDLTIVINNDNTSHQTIRIGLHRAILEIR